MAQKSTRTQQASTNSSSEKKPKPKPKPPLPETPKVPKTETIEDIRADAARNEAAKTEAGSPPPEEPKKKRGRPRKPKTPPPAIPAEYLALLVQFPFNYVAERRGEFWRLTPVEAQTIAALSDQVMQKYLGELAARYGAEIALVLFVGTCIGTRYMRDRQVNPTDESKPQPQPFAAPEPKK